MPGILEQLWAAANKPLTDAPSRVARALSGGLRGMRERTPEKVQSNKLNAILSGLVEGSIEGLGNLATEATSPLGIATSGLVGKGINALSKTGKGLGKIAETITHAPRPDFPSPTMLDRRVPTKITGEPPLRSNVIPEGMSPSQYATKRAAEMPGAGLMPKNPEEMQAARKLMLERASDANERARGIVPTPKTEPLPPPGPNPYQDLEDMPLHELIARVKESGLPMGKIKAASSRPKKHPVFTPGKKKLNP